MSKSKKLKKAILKILSNQEKLDLNTISKRVVPLVDEYKREPELTVKRAVERASESLIQDFPGSFGFYSGSNNEFYTLKHDEIYDDFKFRSKNTRNRKYYIARQNIGIQTFEKAIFELFHGQIGTEKINKLLNGISYSKNIDVKPEHELYFNLASRIEIEPRYQPLYPPIMDEEDFKKILSSLLNEIPFTGCYLEGKKKLYWPVRLIMQERVMYALCKTDEHFNSYKEYALHRFSNIAISTNSSSEQSEFIKQAAKRLNIKYDREEIEIDRVRPIVLDLDHPVIDEIELKFYGRPAQHMSEVRFHIDENNKNKKTQCIEIKPTEPGHKARECHIMARNIEYNYNFKTWLLGFGQQVEVLKPDWLKQDIISELQMALNHYSK